MQEVFPILLEWQNKLGGDINNNTLVLNNSTCEGTIEGFQFSDELHILRFNFIVKDQLEFSGNTFDDKLHIPVFFEEPFNNAALDLDLINGQKEKQHDLDINGAFCTNSKSNLFFEFNKEKPIQLISVRLKKEVFYQFTSKSPNLEKILTQDTPFYVVEEFTPLIAGLYMRAFAIQKDELFHNEMMHAVGIHLVSSFFSKLAERDIISENNKFPFSTKAVMQARSILRSRWDKSLTIDVLAKECGLGVSRLRSLFKQTFGVTIHQFHNDVKLEVGRNMLLEGKLTTYIIAVELGFSSASHFAASFKKKFGMTPKEYQKKHKKE